MGGIFEEEVGKDNFVMPINPERLYDIVKQAVKDSIDEMQDASKYKEEYLTAKDVCQLLKISERTLMKMRTNGIIVPAKLGGRYRYNKRQLMESLPKDTRSTDGKK